MDEQHEEVSPTEVTALIQRLNEQLKPEPDTRTAIEKANDELRGSRSTPAKKSYDTINVHVAALKKNQEALEHATKVANSPMLKVYEAMKSKVIGAPRNYYTPETIDHLTEKHFDISSALANDVKEVRRDAENSLAAITAYKESVFKKYSDALEARRANEHEVDINTKLHQDTVRILGHIKKSDPSYIQLASREKGMKRKLQQNLTNIFKANQQIAFADTALKTLSKSEDQAIMYVVRLDQVENFAESSLEYARNRKKFYDMTSGGENVLSAAQQLCESLSDVVTLQAKQLDAEMMKNKGKALKGEYKMLIPNTLLESKADYTSEIFDSTKATNMQLENLVQGIMQENGRPPI